MPVVTVDVREWISYFRNQLTNKMDLNKITVVMVYALLRMFDLFFYKSSSKATVIEIALFKRF